MSDVASAVAGTVADLFGVVPDAAPEAPANSPSEAVAPEAHETVVLPDLNPELPEDIAELLDEPDFDEIEMSEPTATFSEDDEFVDPEQLARENAKLRKKLEWVETQKTKATQKTWSDEAKKIAPLSRPETITANSRRAFLREARKQHDENFALLAPYIDAYNKAKENVVAEVQAQARADAAAAWGKPTVGSGVAPSQAVEKADKLQAARNSKNLAAVARALIEDNAI